MLVTVYCDASACSETKAVGVAYWLRSERGRFIGSHTGTLDQAYHAEMSAVFMAISKAVAIWDDATSFCINSDCDYVIRVLNRGFIGDSSSENHEKIKEIYNEIRKMQDHLKLHIYARHVKAHTGGVDTRSYINRKVDHLARKAMRIKRETLRREYGHKSISRLGVNA
jgi:ribonuclease HI